MCCWSRSQMRRAGAIGSGVVPSAAGVGVRPDGSQAVGRRGSAIAHRDGGIGHRDGRIGRTSGYPGPFMRRLTAQVVVQAGRPHCHLSGPAAHGGVTTTSQGAHAHIPRQVDAWAPSLRRLTPQVVVQAGRPHCHLSGPAAQERVCVAAADWACRSRIGFAFADRLGACG